MEELSLFWKQAHDSMVPVWCDVSPHGAMSVKLFYGAFFDIRIKLQHEHYGSVIFDGNCWCQELAVTVVISSITQVWFELGILRKFRAIIGEDKLQEHLNGAIRRFSLIAYLNRRSSVAQLCSWTNLPSWRVITMSLLYRKSESKSYTTYPIHLGTRPTFSTISSEVVTKWWTHVLSWVTIRKNACDRVLLVADPKWLYMFRLVSFWSAVNILGIYLWTASS